MLLSAPCSRFEIWKSLACCIISLQWHLMDCWMKAAARVWREETARALVGRSQCTQSWCDVLFPATLSSLAWLPCSKNAVLQLSLVHEAKIMAQCRVMNYAWPMHCGMPCRPPPHTHTPQYPLFILTWGTHPQRIAQTHAHWMRKHSN